MSKTKKKDEENSNPLRAATPKFRVSFPQLFEAKAMEEGQEPKYSVTMLFPKDTDLSALEEAYDAAVAKGMDEKWKGKKPKNLRNPFRDGDEDENYCDKDGYPGHIFVRASTKTKPGVIATDIDPSTGKRRVIDDPAEVYAGCYARATVVAYPYDVAGNRGIAFGLQNVQKLEDGESFSGAKAAEDDFDDEYDDDDDFE